MIIAFSFQELPNPKTTSRAALILRKSRLTQPPLGLTVCQLRQKQHEFDEEEKTFDANYESDSDGTYDFKMSGITDLSTITNFK
jgi:hypothetical protein